MGAVLQAGSEMMRVKWFVLQSDIERVQCGGEDQYCWQIVIDQS